MGSVKVTPAVEPAKKGVCGQGNFCVTPVTGKNWPLFNLEKNKIYILCTFNYRL